MQTDIPTKTRYILYYISKCQMLLFFLSVTRRGGALHTPALLYLLNYHSYIWGMLFLYLGHLFF